MRCITCERDTKSITITENGEKYEVEQCINCKEIYFTNGKESCRVK